MTHPSKLVRVLPLALLLLPALAQAHPGHASDASFAAGALHPLTGLDHVAMLVVAGVFAALLRADTLRVLGAVFIGVLAATATSHVGAGSSVGTGSLAGMGAQAGAAAFTAGLLLTSVMLIAAVAAATHLARQLTAASPR